MAFVVTESCIKCKYTDCVEVCPVDCFHEGPNFLVIDPEECIDCTLCEPECPVEAMFSEDEVPAGQEEFKKLNAELSKKWPVIAEKKPAPPDAKQWEGVAEKKKLLETLLPAKAWKGSGIDVESRDSYIFPVFRYCASSAGGA